MDQGARTMQDDQGDISVRLDRVEDLFASSERALFSDHATSSIPGIDTLVNQMRKPRMLRSRDRIVIVLAEPVEEGIAEQTAEALRRYCRAHLRQNANELTSMHREGLTGLQFGFLFLGLSLILSSVFVKFVHPDWLSTFLSEGVLVVGWVGLWRPVDLLLFEWVPYRRDNRIYRHIMKMEVDIRSAKSVSVAPHGEPG